MLSASLRASLRTSARTFHSARVARAASIFRMPAMSPTMTEGGIVSWKLKAGDKFAAGDVLLEVETDKATIDVEAQDDGVVWELLKSDGDKGIPVGQPIAYLAEPEDDLSALEKPKDDEAPQEPKEPKKEEPKKEEPKKEPAPKKDVAPAPKKEEPKGAAPAADKAAASVFGAANPQQKLSPAVELLLHENHISADDAFAKIQASGPKGRLLKGDVLAYLGAIKPEAVSKIAQWIKSREHLDLSNIVLAEPKKDEPKKGDAAAAAAAAAEAAKPSNIFDLSITVDLSQFNGLQNFKAYTPTLIKDATSIAYQRKFPQYSEGPSAAAAAPAAPADIFDELIAPAVTQSRFEVVDVKFDHWDEIAEVPVPSASRAAAAAPAAVNTDDIFFDLIDQPQLKSSAGAPALARSNALVDLELKVKINEKVSDSAEFYKYFEEALYELLEPLEKESV